MTSLYHDPTHANVKASVIIMSTARDAEYLQVLLSVLADYSWVRNVTILLTDYKSAGLPLSEPTSVPDRDYGNVRFFGANCYGGWGASEALRTASVIQGGFSEIRARNDLITLGEQQLVEGDYLLALDPDEVILPGTHAVLVEASRRGARQIWFSTITLLGRNTQAVLPANEEFNTIGKVMYDPHIRIYRKGFRYIQNPGIDWTPDANTTEHCSLAPELNPFDGQYTYVTEAILHLHLPYTFGPKCIFRTIPTCGSSAIANGERTSFDEGLLPRQVLDAILAHEQELDRTLMR